MAKHNLTVLFLDVDYQDILDSYEEVDLDGSAIDAFADYLRGNHQTTVTELVDHDGDKDMITFLITGTDEAVEDVIGTFWGSCRKGVVLEDRLPTNYTPRHAA